MSIFLVVSLILACLAYTQTIKPDSIPLASRTQWCSSQKTQCPLLCLQYDGNDATTINNDCDPQSLSYSCVCAVNGLTPDASEYSLTLPYFICTETNNQCVTACGQNNICANACRVNNPCGARNPTRFNTSTITSTMAKTATDQSPKNTGGSDSGPEGEDSKYSGFGGANATPKPSSSNSNPNPNSNKSGSDSLLLKSYHAYAYAASTAIVGLFVAFVFIL